MKTKLIQGALFFSLMLSFSCSDDSENNNQSSTDMSLDHTVYFEPQSDNFTKKIITNFQNNKPTSAITYNNADVMTSRREYAYTATTTTIYGYNAQDVLSSKVIYTYDTAKRLTNIKSYNGQNVLITSRSYQYEGHDIYLYNLDNGSPVLTFTFKTNADNLIYQEYSVLNDDTKTLSYASDLPTQLDQEGAVMPYEVYPNSKPGNIQNTVNEINNGALTGPILDHVYFSCNYYLKKVDFPFIDVTTYYDKTFNANNYQTYAKVSVRIGSNTQTSNETFFYYN